MTVVLCVGGGGGLSEALLWAGFPRQDCWEVAVIRVYVLDLAGEWEWAVPADPSEALRFDDTFGTPLRSSWSPMRVKLIVEDESGGKLWRADMPWNSAGVLIMRPRAVRVLAELCERDGEMLPLVCEGEEFMAWNVTTVVDALDLENSVVSRFPSSGHVSWVDKYAFKPEQVAGRVAFRVPELPPVIFVTGGFVKRVRDAGLTGTGFQLVWEG